ncbi:MAG: RNA methyltransferase [Prevotellaceae bacterium]|jgi:TrmH family RNA methyltransferase|nr:RNA methyltransferase [Prevotellaceae bacterium]
MINIREEALITSLRNPKISNVITLKEKSRERHAHGLFVVEGAREIGHALLSGYRLDALYMCSNIGAAALFEQSLPPSARVYPVSGEVFAKMAYRENSDGLIAVMQLDKLSLENVKLSRNPFVVIMEAVEKPGNLGAVLRTADAASADAVLVCDPHTDLYNPNVIRSSIGCVFTQQVVACSSESALHWLHAKGIKSFAAALDAPQAYHETDFTQPCAIVMGTEASGLTAFWLEHADARIKIPMRGKIDSLNVSVSTAVLTFEAMRQRGFKNEF